MVLHAVDWHDHLGQIICSNFCFAVLTFGLWLIYLVFRLLFDGCRKSHRCCFCLCDPGAPNIIRLTLIDKKKNNESQTWTLQPTMVWLPALNLASSSLNC